MSAVTAQEANRMRQLFCSQGAWLVAAGGHYRDSLPTASGGEGVAGASALSSLILVVVCRSLSVNESVARREEVRCLQPECSALVQWCCREQVDAIWGFQPNC